MDRVLTFASGRQRCFPERRVEPDISTEADAYAYLETLRWGDTPKCAVCASTDVYLIGCANGVSRATRTGKMSERRVWKCRSCKRQFSVLTGTMMHGTKIPVRIWVMVIFEMCSSKYGVCPRTAWFLLHRIREAMRGEGMFAPMSGTIVADETWIGGKPSNRHQPRRSEPVEPEGQLVLPGTLPGGRLGYRHTEKQPVLTLINAETGEARSHVVANVTGRTLGKVIANNVAMYNSTLHTDSSSSYYRIGHLFADHQSVDHNIGEYVRDGVSTNLAEGFFSQLKRSVDGTHHHVSVERLPQYLSEFDYRYSTRKMVDADRMAKLMGQCRTPLPYATLIAR